jgi:hypothetical protein
MSISFINVLLSSKKKTEKKREKNGKITEKIKSVVFAIRK